MRPYGERKHYLGPRGPAVCVNDRERREWRRLAKRAGRRSRRRAAAVEIARGCEA